MEPEKNASTQEDPGSNAGLPSTPIADIDRPSDKPAPGLAQQVFIGEHGLRGGWSVFVFVIVMVLLLAMTAFLVGLLHLSVGRGDFTARAAILGELSSFISLIGAAAAVALIERRRILDFNLRGPRPVMNFFSGLAAGFIALSALVAALWSGGWLHFGPISLSGIAVAKYAALWGIAFLLVGCVEEGIFRCYLQFTFSRSLNFWVALAILAVVCIVLAIRTKGTEAWGVYTMVLIGLVPCLMLELKHTPNASFWQAAWVTSTIFGFIHVSNKGENWIGIFAAAVIGFVFCVSVWVTGSAWWAIGCHAGWDWGETYFYGTANSGLVAPGHYLSTTPIGKGFWSGGTDGPEGSILVLGAILLLLVALLAIYGRKNRLATAH